MKRIDVLPDDVLLEIFDFYVIVIHPSYSGKTEIEGWQTLVHVCRRWRGLVLGSPHRLNLRLYCTPETPAKDRLDIWPALPLIVGGYMTSSRTDNVIAALGQSSRICCVSLNVGTVDGRRFEEFLGAMQVPFPELTELQLSSYGETVPVIPDSFLGGSAPRLRCFDLFGISFPGLPNLILSATHLVDLALQNICHSWYISPEVMVTLLSVLSSLRKLSLGFKYPQSRPDWETRRPPPPKRSILPTLEKFRFKGVTEYLDDLVTFIDTPQLYEIHIYLFNQIDFDCPRLAQFINRTPKLMAPDGAYVQFDNNTARVTLQYWTYYIQDGLQINILCGEPDWQLSSVEQVCTNSLPLLLAVEDLYIECLHLKLVWKDDAIENTLWLQLLLPFTGVINLYLSKEFARGIAAALKDLVGGRITEVLPILQNIFVEALEASGPFQKDIGQFVAARQLSDHAVAVSDWNKYIKPR